MRCRNLRVIINATCLYFLKRVLNFYYEIFVLPRPEVKPDVWARFTLVLHPKQYIISLSSTHR